MELVLPRHRVIHKRLWQTAQRVEHSLASPQFSHERHHSMSGNFMDTERVLLQRFAVSLLAHTGLFKAAVLKLRVQPALGIKQPFHRGLHIRYLLYDS